MQAHALTCKAHTVFDAKCGFIWSHGLNKLPRGRRSCTGNNLMVLVSCIDWYSSVLHWKLLPYVDKFPCVMIWACWRQAAHLHADSGPAFTLAFCPRPGHPQRCLCWQPLCLCLLGPLGQCAQGQPSPMGFLPSWLWQRQTVSQSPASHLSLFWRGKRSYMGKIFFFLWCFGEHCCGCCVSLDIFCETCLNIVTTPSTSLYNKCSGDANKCINWAVWFIILILTHSWKTNQIQSRLLL